MKEKKIKVLLVEDNPADVDLTLEALSESKVEIDIDVVEDGDKALSYLRMEPPHEGVARPDLILLDLNLPKRDGRAVLKDIKGDKDLKFIPVVILTTSDAEKDIMSTYDNGANCYITKPVGLDQFSKIVRIINDFWFTIVKLPTRK